MAASVAGNGGGDEENGTNVPVVAAAIPPATVTWITDGDGFWDVASNWSTGVVPTATDSVLIDRPGVPASTFGCSGDNFPGVVADDEGTDGAFETSCQNATPAFIPGGHYTPNNPLTGFDGQNSAGTWSLNVSDGAGGDTGSGAGVA